MSTDHATHIRIGTVTVELISFKHDAGNAKLSVRVGEHFRELHPTTFPG